MHDHILHFRVIDRALGFATPCVHGGVVVRKNPDDVNGVQVFELYALGVEDSTSHDEM